MSSGAFGSPLVGEHEPNPLVEMCVFFRVRCWPHSRRKLIPLSCRRLGCDSAGWTMASDRIDTLSQSLRYRSVESCRS